MKAITFSAIALCLMLGTAHASEFTLSQTLDENISTSNSHWEEAWNFTTLPGWNNDLTIESVEITEVFSNVASGSNFQSTILPYNTTIPNSTAAVFTPFPGPITLATATGGETDTKTVTETVPSPLTLADITTGGVAGEFDTRVSRYNSGSFELDSITVDITADAPEPSSFLLLGLGLAGMALMARFRFERA